MGEACGLKLDFFHNHHFEEVMEQPDVYVNNFVDSQKQLHILYQMLFDKRFNSFEGFELHITEKDIEGFFNRFKERVINLMKNSSFEMRELFDKRDSVESIEKCTVLENKLVKMQFAIGFGVVFFIIVNNSEKFNYEKNSHYNRYYDFLRTEFIDSAFKIMNNIFENSIFIQDGSQKNLKLNLLKDCKITHYPWKLHAEPPFWDIENDVRRLSNG